MNGLAHVSIGQGGCSVGIRRHHDGFACSILQVGGVSGRDGDLAGVVSLDRSHVLGRSRRFATPCVGPRQGGANGALNRFGDAGTAAGARQNCFRHLGADGVVLISRQCHGSQDTDDGHDDHQFDQGKTFLHCFHFNFLQVWLEKPLETLRLVRRRTPCLFAPGVPTVPGALVRELVHGPRGLAGRL